jgi:hypothetical protein
MDDATTAIISPLPLITLVGLGGFGALLVEALKHVRKLEGRQWPDTFEMGVSLILILVGGGVAGLYRGQVESILIAAQIGASAPAIIGAWASGGQQPPAGRGGGRVMVDPATGTATIAQADLASQVGRALSWRH